MERDPSQDANDPHRGRLHPDDDRERRSRSHQTVSPPRLRGLSASQYRGRRHSEQDPNFTYMPQIPSPPRWDSRERYKSHESRDVQLPSPPRISRDLSPLKPRPEQNLDARKHLAPRERSQPRRHRPTTPERKETSALIPTLVLPDGQLLGPPLLSRSVSHNKIKNDHVDKRNSSATTRAGGLLGVRVYRYKPLRKGEFRLIVLLPSRSAIVRCQVIHCTLKNPEFAYKAVSYAWGNVGEKRTIRIRDTDGDEEVEISVTASLENALRALRKREERIYVWADALSIDQQNPAEKKDQVQKMTQIYQKAKSVAIWLGPEADDSELALALIHQVGIGTKLPERISDHTLAPFTRRHLAATAALFDRDYWHRLWVIQEVFNAREIKVHCGDSFLPWNFFKTTSEIFQARKTMLHQTFPIGSRSERYYTTNSNLSVPQALRYQGPTSFLDLGSPERFRDLEAMPSSQLFSHLLQVMQMCRRKLSSDPRDKVFGILGVLPLTVRDEILVDYEISTRDVYINIVDILLRTTGSLDVICEAIHFPPHANNVSVPSWVPDWSHVPGPKPIGTEYQFSASGTSTHKSMIDPYMKSKLEISAIHLGVVEDQGIALGTLCTLSDYMMAFLHWRSILLDSFSAMDKKALIRAQEDFCLTLCLHQVPTAIESAGSWMDLCYHVFSSSIQDRLPRLAIDDDLKRFAHMRLDMSLGDRREFIQEHIASRMMGRRFLITADKLMGLGTGFLVRGDIIVVALGCSTPIVLRPEGEEYRFVGDAYISGYMRGKAIQESEEGVKGRDLRKYVLH